MISVGWIIWDSVGHLERWIEWSTPHCGKQGGTGRFDEDQGVWEYCKWRTKAKQGMTWVVRKLGLWNAIWPPAKYLTTLCCIRIEITMYLMSIKTKISKVHGERQTDRQKGRETYNRFSVLLREYFKICPYIRVSWFWHCWHFGPDNC